jgi:hypothetical protein
MAGTPEVYIVTNTTVLGEYTPSVFKKYKDAADFMIETTMKNIRDGFPDVPEYEGPVFGDDAAINDALAVVSSLHWINKIAKPYIKEKFNCDVSATDRSTFIQYRDETENRMTLYILRLDDTSSSKTYTIFQR